MDWMKHVGDAPLLAIEHVQHDKARRRGKAEDVEDNSEDALLLRTDANVMEMHQTVVNFGTSVSAIYTTRARREQSLSLSLGQNMRGAMVPRAYCESTDIHGQESGGRGDRLGPWMQSVGGTISRVPAQFIRYSAAFVTFVVEVLYEHVYCGTLVQPKAESLCMLFLASAHLK